MTPCCLLLAAALLAGDSPPLTVQARIVAEGDKTVLEIKHQWTEGFATSPIAPIAQIATPSCMTLDGEALSGRALQKNEFLRAPHELLLEKELTRIGFTLTGHPEPSDRVAINILAYAEGPAGKTFIRQRLALPLAPDAQAQAVAVQPSDWGADQTLQLGDAAVPFTLPAADGTTVDLSAYLGKKNVVITTYRAFW